MKLTVNGEPLDFDGRTITDLLLTLELQGKRLAVEVNREIIPKGEHANHFLNDTDTIEIVHAIGGG